MQGDSPSEFLRWDVERLKRLFGRFRELKQTDLGRAYDLFQGFREGVERHLRWHERLVRPALSQATECRVDRELQALLGVMEHLLATGSAPTPELEDAFLKALEGHARAYEASDAEGSLTPAQRSDLLRRIRLSES